MKKEYDFSQGKRGAVVRQDGKTRITIYLDNGGLLEHAQEIAGHADPRTTKLYDRTRDAISLDEIEKIVI